MDYPGYFVRRGPENIGSQGSETGGSERGSETMALESFIGVLDTVYVDVVVV